MKDAKKKRQVRGKECIKVPSGVSEIMAKERVQEKARVVCIGKAAHNLVPEAQSLREEQSVAAVLAMVVVALDVAEAHALEAEAVKSVNRVDNI